MKKQRKNIFLRAASCTAAFFALVFSAQSCVFASSNLRNGTQNGLRNGALAHAESPVSTAQTAATDYLFLPDSYEEYLSLTEPTSVAVNDDYTAIADGKKIYIYSRANGTYSTYEHNVPDDTKLMQIQFDERGTLYFSAQGSATLYSLSPETLLAADTNLTCSAFEIFGDTLYFTTIVGTEANVFARSLDALSIGSAPIKTNVAGKPAIAHNGDALYYTVGGILASVEQSNALIVCNDSIQSLSFYGDYCYFTDTQSCLYSYRYADSAATAQKIAEDCISLSQPHEGLLYVVGKQKIRCLNAESGEFTPYEISASSTSDHRLYDAVDCIVSGDTLVTLDRGSTENSAAAKARLLVSDLTQNSSARSRSIALSDTGVERVSSDGKTALVSSTPANSVSATQSGVLSLYDLESGARLASFVSAEDSPFIGVANVYGTYYAASKYYFYRIDRNENGYALVSRKTTRSNALLSSDAYGSLYVAQSDRNVYAFTEAEFLDETVNPRTEEAIAKLPSSYVHGEKASFAIDFLRGVYLLRDGTFYRCESTSAAKDGACAQQAYPLTQKTLVYNQTAETPVTCASFGWQNNATYVVYDGNFIVKTHDLPIPSLNTLSVEGSDSPLFAAESTDFTLVELPEKTLLVRFNLNSLKNSEYFPYLSHARTSAPLTAISLGETSRYRLLAVYDGSNNDYFTALAEKDACTEVSPDDFFTPPPQQFSAKQKGYVTNDVGLYKYPFLTDLLTICTVKRGTEIVVLKTVERLDWLYYAVAYTDENGEYKTGYLPAAYVSDVSGKTPPSVATMLGEERNNSDLVWRLVYLVLGALVVCILTDYLILKKHGD